jgi:hypothetical protein
MILEINLDNDAWVTDEGEVDLQAVGDALSDVRKALWSGCDKGKIIDTNGNKSGEWRIL